MNIFGTQEDFLSTILTTGYNLEELIESKPTARGQIITKFLGLESLKQKEDIAKEMYSEWSKKLVSNTNNKTDLDDQIKTFEDSIGNSNTQITDLGVSLDGFKDTLKNLEDRRDLILGQKNNDIDDDLIRTNPTLLQREIEDLKRLQTSSKTQGNDVSVVEPSQYYLDEEHDKLKDKVNSIVVDGKLVSETITRNENLVNQLEKGSVCPTCHRALDEVDHTSEIEKIKKEIEGLKDKQTELKSQYTEANDAEKLYAAIKKEYDEYERNKLRKSRFELEVEQKQLEIDSKQLKLDNYENNKKKLEENQKIDALVIKLRTQIETASANIRVTNTSIEKNRNNITNMNEKIGVNNDLISKIKSEEDLLAVFKIYLTIYGKNGISKIIMKNMIPLINQELYRLLVDSCHFILELNVNDKNEVEFIMIDTETRIVKPLNSGSGYERTISSLALRSVLTKISSLPKPNIVVMDEVFGKIADENLEMVGEFFKKIKDYFEHIFVISHNSLIRNWSDNLIMIKKDENVSSIDFITTKIS